MRFPLFVDLNGKRVVLIGCGKVGSRRAAALLEFGAEVIVIDPVSETIDGTEHIARSYEIGDIRGADLCVAASNVRQVNMAAALEAKALGVPVSVADDPEMCDFYFPALCVSDELVAGVVSVNGDHKKVASAAKKIRKILEEPE